MTDDVINNCYLCSMTSNAFRRQIWLIKQLLDHGRLTFQEITQLWELDSVVHLDREDKYEWRTFQRHRQNIADNFGIDIECDRLHGNVYYIANLELLDNLHTWLIDTYSIMFQVQADQRLAGRILMEDIPSGRKWLFVITEAMRKGITLQITHKGFEQAQANTFKVEPYCLKIVKRRWYLLGRSDYGFRTYALDRILAVEPGENEFSMVPGFDAKEYFEGCMGIIKDDYDPIQKVRLISYNPQYHRSLPLHPSQVELSYDEVSDTSVLELTVQPNYDFIENILMQGEQIEVVSPPEVREEVSAEIRRLINRYNIKINE